MSDQVRAEDAPLALRCILAEDTYALALVRSIGAAQPWALTDERLGTDWKIRGYLTGSDTVFEAGPLTFGHGPVFYGWVLEAAEQPGHCLIVVRGTIGLPEWLKDAEFAPRLHPVAGRVECGFWSIYATMGLNGKAGNAAADLAQLLKDAISVTVTGHSLGAALGHLLAFDIAAPELLGSRVQSIQFASPRPGDAAFGEALRARIPGHRAYAYELDLVPRVPFGFGFSPVPGTIELPAIHPAIRVKCSLTCNHHALSYASLLDPTSLASFPAISVDLPFFSCVAAA